MWISPPWKRIASSFGAAVVAGTTAMKRKPSIFAKYASDTAVDPDEDSITVVSGPIHSLHSAYRNSDRASRCLRLPVGCELSSFRYSTIPG